MSFCSGNKSMIGYGVAGSISAECAPSRLRTLRANSTVASCIPRQIPKNGTLFSRAKRVASIFPSIPRSPNPPGTRIPSAEPSNSLTFSRVTSSALIQSISMALLKAKPACFNASATEMYASRNSTYFPTSAIFVVFSRCVTVWTSCFQAVMSAAGVSNLK